MVQLNLLLLTYLILYALRSGTQVYLSRLNISYLRQHGHTVPEFFRDVIDREKLEKISAYTVESANLSIFSILVHQIFFLAILLSGLLPWFIGIFSHWRLGLIGGGLAFFALLAVLINLVGLPFNIYRTFGIETRYGFNTKTIRVWIMDFLKSLAISAPLGALLLWLLLSLIRQGGGAWWFWAWMAVGLFELLILWLYPLIIAPLFNKFEPIQNEELVRRIEELMARAGLRAKGVFRMDASRRSRHTNAYFTGVGKSKRIVLFDTLLNSHTDEEILAILAHEVGHWKRKHVLKQLIFAEVSSLVGFYVLAKLLNWPLVYQTFGFPQPIPYVGLFLIGALFGPILYFAQPLESAFSRKFEREADDFSVDLMGTPEPMGSALRRLAVDNLANLNPHPYYAWFYYSHPPLAERVERIRKMSQFKGSGSA